MIRGKGAQKDGKVGYMMYVNVCMYILWCVYMRKFGILCKLAKHKILKKQWLSKMFTI